MFDSTAPEDSPQAVVEAPIGSVAAYQAGGAADVREQLVNAGEMGPAQAIQVSMARIYQVRGILFDLDPNLLNPELVLGGGPIEPTPLEFFGQNVRPLLLRDPILQRAEVRTSGRGLHGILWFDPFVPCETDGQREDIAAAIEVVTRLLPVDPMQPGITALTRAIGSTNSKNGASVEILKPGSSVTAVEVRALAEQIVAAPLRKICNVLFGGDIVRPCPACRAADSYLSVEDHRGWCYACGAVTLDSLWAAIYRKHKGDQAREEARA